MPGPQPDPARIYRFGDFELNPNTRQLMHQGRRVPIQLKPFELLVYLIRHRDRVVPRDELLAQIWRDVHVDEAAVRFTVHRARVAVCDDGDRQEVICTIPGAGFRFVAPVEVLADPMGHEPGRTEVRGAGAFQSPFLGRSRLLAEGAALLDDAARGQGGMLLMNGEAGIGKTRALEQLAKLAGPRGFRVLQGQCVESEGAPAFWPWIQILRAAVAADVPLSMLYALGESAPEVAWMVPELRPFVPDVPQMGSLDAQAARFMLFDGVTSFLNGLAVDRPHLLCIDDLHRADTASLALLLHVARELAGTQAMRIALIGGYRDMELRAIPAHSELVTSASALARVQSESLRGLDAEEVRVLVENLSGRAPSAEVVSELHHKTNGNPFFLFQILRVLETEQRLSELESGRTVDLELPRHVQDAICRRVRLLPDPVRELIELASVVGREFAVRDLEVAAGLERAEVLARLGVAVDADVVSEATEFGRFRFVHALVGDAICARLSLDVRAAIHGRIARAIESRCGEGASADSAVIAHHYANSPNPEDGERAIRAYEMAALWCIARGAFDNAPEYLERALTILAASPLSTEPNRCRLLLQLGEALMNAGARDRARECLLTVAEIAKQQRLREELAVAALRFAPDFLAIETGIYDPQLVGLLEEALESLGDAPTPMRAKLLARLGIALQWSPVEELRSRSICDEAVTIAAQCDDPGTRHYADLAQMVIRFSLVDPKRQLRLVPTISRSTASLDLIERLLRITSLILLGRIHEADVEISLFAARADESRHPQARWYADLMRSTRALMDGRYEEAAGYTERYMDVGTKLGDRNAVHSYAAQDLMRAFDVGGLEVYESRIRGIVEAFPRMMAWRASLAFILTELGRPNEARYELSRVFASEPLRYSRPNEWYGTAASLALAAGALGDRNVGASLYSILLPQADHLVVFGYCSYCAGSVQRLLAASATAMDQWDLAAGHFEAALSKNSAVGAPACNARVLFEYAAMLMKADRRPAGTRTALRAEEAAKEFGMVHLAARSRKLCE